MADVFISYAREDYEQARLVAQALTACGWSVWWDRRILAGQTFDQVIERELEAAKSVVVLWSTSSVTSEWVKNEAAVAAERGVLVPVFIDEVKLPLEFRRRQTANLLGWKGETSHEGFQAVRDAITAITTGIVSPRPIPQPQPRMRWNRRHLIASTLTIALGLAFGMYWLTLSGDDRPTEIRKMLRPHDELVQRLSEAQQKAVELLEQGRRDQAAALIERNIRAIDLALQTFPESVPLQTLRGYILKDKYVSTKGAPAQQRREYLDQARESFTQALRLDPDNASAHNGMGNVFFFLGQFDAAIEQHELALRLTRGNYPAAEHDKRLVEQVREGTVPFDF
jgi:hypothetical protein